MLRDRSSKAGARCKLASEWAPTRDADGQIVASGRLWLFIEKIAQCRREGKNRRDGATVSKRVLRLADQLGKELSVVTKVKTPSSRPKLLNQKNGMGSRLKALL